MSKKCFAIIAVFAMLFVMSFSAYGQETITWENGFGFHCNAAKGNGKVVTGFETEAIELVRVGTTTTWDLDTDEIVCPVCERIDWVTFSNKNGVINGKNIQVNHSDTPAYPAPIGPAGTEDPEIVVTFRGKNNEILFSANVEPGQCIADTYMNWNTRENQVETVVRDLYDLQGVSGYPWAWYTDAARENLYTGNFYEEPYESVDFYILLDGSVTLAGFGGDDNIFFYDEDGVLLISFYGEPGTRLTDAFIGESVGGLEVYGYNLVTQEMVERKIIAEWYGSSPWNWYWWFLGDDAMDIFYSDTTGQPFYNEIVEEDKIYSFRLLML